MSVRTSLPIAALTFDDGPDEYHTPRILDVLSQHEANATFFVLAQRATLYPQILAAIRDAGHEIALHGEDHSPLIGRSMLGKFEHIRAGKRRLEKMLTERVRFFRPPYGWQDVRAFLAARAAGLEVIGWTVAGGDWQDLTPLQVAERVESGLAQGSILLLHDRAEPLPGRPGETLALHLDRAQVVEEVVRRAAGRGLEFVSVGSLLRDGHPVRRPWFWRPVGPEAALPPGG